jgi:hypothetical protein
LSYNTRVGHGYGGQSRRGSSGSHSYPGKRQGANIKPLQHRQSIDQPNNPNFMIIAKVLQTWDKPTCEFNLPNDEDPQQLAQTAYTLAQTANQRKLELQVMEPKNTIEYRVERIQDLENQLPEENILPIEQGQSFEAHQLLSDLNVQLKVFGWHLTKV